MVASQAIIITVPASAGGDSVELPTAMLEPSLVPNRKRRLAHLTIEEKLYRKKLKNRVAAQTSRDRKKAKLDELESSVGDMLKEIDMLRNVNDRLTSENKLLKQQLDEYHASHATLMETILEKDRCCCGKNQTGTTQTVLTDVPSNTSRPAESLNNPLLKGLDRTSLVMNSLRIALMACLASQSSSRTSNLMKICRILEIWNASPRACCKKPLAFQPRRVLQLQNRTQSQPCGQWWGKHQRSWNPVDQASCKA